MKTVKNLKTGESHIISDKDWEWLQENSLSRKYEVIDSHDETEPEQIPIPKEEIRQFDNGEMDAAPVDNSEDLEYDIDGMRQWLNENDVEVHHRAGDKKIIELFKEHHG